jgi:formate dehydrogenase maturation protein FdhE
VPAEAKTELKRQGRCRGCGCPWDQFTDGCRNCEARHQMRRLYVERAAAA